MRGFLNKVVAKIYQNGIRLGDSSYEKENLIAFNWQVSICILVSLLFIVLSFFYEFYLLTYFSVSYLLLFSATYFCISIHRFNWAKYIYLFTSNYSVFTISFCFGYEAGFYFYFFTTPLTVYITFSDSKSIFIYLALFTYLANAFTLNFLHHNNILVNPGIINDTVLNILFNLNLLTAFFMIFILIGSFMKINRLKTREAKELYQKHRILEAEIHQKQLNETKVHYQYQKLESEYQQLDMFNHIISHNLRGPISRVSGLLELLKQFPYTSEEQQTLMTHLNTSVLMIDEVIIDLNHILVQKKLGQESSTDITLHEILQEVKFLLAEEIQISNAIIHEHLFIAKVDCVKGIMVSIFYNLISNSIKYSIPNQKPTIIIIAEVINNQLVLTFKDDGIGFDAEKYGEKLFRLYSRFHDHVAGKGMGLFLVKSHVDMLDGKIAIQSSPRKGAAFTITIPLKELVID
jgi:signal transduction histidine kinase